MIVKDMNGCVGKESFTTVLFTDKLAEDPCKLVKFQMCQGTESLWYLQKEVPVNHI